jgi:SAM-dependent methyltransferase
MIPLLLLLSTAGVFGFNFPIIQCRPQIGQARCCSNGPESEATLSATTRRIIDGLVLERMQYRLDRNYIAADRILSTLKLEHSIEVTDYPYKSGGHSTWRYVASPTSESGSEIETDGSSNVDDMMKDGESLMNIARNAYANLNAGIKTDREIVDSSLRLLRLADYDKFLDPGYVKEMQGRKFADAAFYFSLAGITSTDLYSLLLAGAVAEIRRYGNRKSCRPVDILHVVERLAVAGILDQEVYGLAAAMLENKIEATGQSGPFSRAISRLSSGSFTLFSDMPLMWLWRFSARQRKHGNQASRSKEQDEEAIFSQTETEKLVAKNRNITLCLPIFDDPTLPLVVDIGCGFGVSVLGLSYRQHCLNAAIAERGGKHTVEGYRKRNFIACDMSDRAVSYASGIARRWGLHETCHFIESDAASFLDLLLKEYIGPVECVLINFPTPYQFGADSHIADDVSQYQGNSQLPTDMTEFMVTPSVIEQCRQLLERRAVGPVSTAEDLINSANTIGGGDSIEGNERSIDTVPLVKYLLIQTNVEDVAVTMKNIVCNSSNFGEDRGLFIPDSSLITDHIEASWNEDQVMTSDSSADRVVYTAKNDMVTSAMEGEGDRLENTVDDEKTVEFGRTEDLADLEPEGAEDSIILQKRAVKWILSGGERARGSGWLKVSPLPRAGRTETEAMCDLNKKPVHRLLFAMRHPPQ